MKKTSLLLLATVAMLAACGDKDEVAPAPVAVDKIITYKVFAGRDYTNSHYADHEATVYLTIRRSDRASLNETVVFDTTFTKALKDFPLESKPILIRKKIQDVLVEKENIGVGSGTSVGAYSFGSYKTLPDSETEKTIKVVL